VRPVCQTPSPSSPFNRGCVLIWKTEGVQTGNKPSIAADFTVLRGLLQTPADVATAGIHTSQWQDKKTRDSSVGNKGFFRPIFLGNEFGHLPLQLSSF